MGCVTGYCSKGTNIIISKDKRYTASIISNILTTPMYSNKTNNHLLNLSARQDSDKYNKDIMRLNSRHAYSNKDLKIPDNPLPFVKIKPKKSD